MPNCLGHPTLRAENLREAVMGVRMAGFQAKSHGQISLGIGNQAIGEKYMADEIVNIRVRRLDFE
jgi:hypothetical protein